MVEGWSSAHATSTNRSRATWPLSTASVPPSGDHATSLHGSPSPILYRRRISAPSLRYRFLQRTQSRHVPLENGESQRRVYIARFRRSTAFAAMSKLCCSGSRHCDRQRRSDGRCSRQSDERSFIAVVGDSHRLQRVWRKGEHRGLWLSPRQSGSRRRRSPVGRATQRDRTVER